MAESSVIREFLVALGFKTDEAALKKFDNGIQQATKSVFTLAAAVEATAIAVSVGVTRMSSNLETLYFASLKTHASALNLKAFDRAAQNLGTQAGEALNSVQGLARFLRNNPGGEGFLKGLGVETRDANGQLRDMTDVMMDLSKTFAKQPYYLANQYAGILGISEDTLRAMRSGEFATEVARMRRELKDSGFDQATKKAHEFMVLVRDLKTQLEIFGVKVYDAISRKLGISLESITNWLRDNGPWLASRIADVISIILDLAEKIGTAIKWVIDKLIEADAATDGWSTKILALLGVMKLFGGFEIVGGILGLAAAFVKLGAGIAKAGAASTAASLLTIPALAAAGGAGWALGRWIDSKFSDETNNKIGAGVAYMMSMLGSTEAREAFATNDPVKYFMNLGWGHSQAAGIVANLGAESELNPRAVGDNGKAYGVAQWHKDRQDSFAKWAGKDIRDSSLYEQFEFVNYELRRGAEQRAGAMLMAAQNAQQAGEVVSRYYERPGDADEQASIRGQAAVTIAQKTEINVHGGNAAETGREVASQQRQVNADLVRNTQARVQ